MKMTLLLALLNLTACSTGRLVVETDVPPRIALTKNLRTVEIQNISGQYAENLKMALAQILSEQTPLQVIHSQDTGELINAKLRGISNRQNYPQADLIIRGQTQESIERRMKKGSTQFAATSRLYLQLIKSNSGEVLISDYFIGTSISNTYLENSNTIYDGFTDALASARRAALDKFISQFTPQREWTEIDLIPYKDSKKFDEAKNLISYGRLELAKEQTNSYIKSISFDDSESGKALFTLAVIESLLGNLETAKINLLESNKLYPSETSMKYFKEIQRMEMKRKNIAQSETKL